MKQSLPIKSQKKFVYTKEEKKKASIKELKPYFKYYKKFKGNFIFIAVLLIISTVFSILIPIYSGYLIASFTEKFVWETTMRHALFVFVFILTLNIIDFLINRIWALISINSSYFITNDFTKKLNLITLKSFDQAESGTFTTRMYGDIDTVATVPLRLMTYSTNLIGNITFVAYIFSINPWLGLFMFAYVLIYLFLQFQRINKRQKNQKIIRKYSETENSLRNENLRGMKDIRCINATDTLIKKSMDVSKEKLIYSYSSSRQIQKISLVRQIISTVLDFLFIALCVYLIVNKQLFIAGFMIAYNYRGKIKNFASYIVTVKDYLSECSLAAQKLNEIFDESKYPFEKFGEKTLQNVNGLIEFKNVTFGYDEKTVLKNVNLTILPNRVTSFVGLSGAGKSTIVSLISRLYNIEEGNGEICLDGINIKELDKDSLRNSVCTISQSPYIFNMTVRENMRLAKEDATDEEIISALKKAEIYDYIDSKPNKLDSILGENGIMLSGGQSAYQRIWWKWSGSIHRSSYYGCTWTEIWSKKPWERSCILLWTGKQIEKSVLMTVRCCH